MNPKISMIMSVYNGSAHLAESIESVLAQTYSDFEFVIIDDASTDETPSILARYAALDNRIVLVRNEQNLGLTKSLNKAIRASIGEYVARMDAGDTSEPDRFMRQAAFLDANSEYCLVGTSAWVIDDKNNKVGSMVHATDDTTLRKVLIRYNPFVHSSLMMRRTALDAVGLYDEAWKYSQDYDLLLRLLPQGKMANIAACLVSYRVYENSITRRKNKQQTLLAMKARTRAIAGGSYPWWSYVWLARPLLGYLFPYQMKQWIKSIMS